MQEAGAVNGNSPANPNERDRLAQEIADALSEHGERPRQQIRAIVGALGVDTARELLEQTWRVESGGGMLVGDGSRRRSPGGVFFALARRRLTRKARKQIFGTADATPVNVVIVERLRRAPGRGELETDDDADDDEAPPSSQVPPSSAPARSAAVEAPPAAASGEAQAPVRRRRIVPFVVAKPPEPPPPPVQEKPARGRRRKEKPAVAPGEQATLPFADAAAPERRSRRAAAAKTPKPGRAKSEPAPKSELSAERRAREVEERALRLADVASHAFAQAAERAFSSFADEALASRRRNVQQSAAMLERQVEKLVGEFADDIIKLLQKSVYQSLVDPFTEPLPRSFTTGAPKAGRGRKTPAASKRPRGARAAGKASKARPRVEPAAPRRTRGGPAKSKTRKAAGRGRGKRR